MDLSSTPDTTEAVALELLAAVASAATARGVRLSAAVVDRGGNLVAARRADGAQVGAMLLALDKAYTAVAFGAPTARWAESSIPGAPNWGLSGSLGGRASAIAGGLPLVTNGWLIGGLGVSGAASHVDAECAREALRAMAFEGEQ